MPAAGGGGLGGVWHVKGHILQLPGGFVETKEGVERQQREPADSVFYVLGDLQWTASGCVRK